MSTVARTHGVTVIEMMVAMIVLAVLVMMVAPSMRGMIARQRVQSVQAEVLTDLQLARSEMTQRVGTSTPVVITFGSNASLTCYTLHTDGAACDCTLGAGSVCAPAGAEIKTARWERAVGVSVAASSPSGNRLVFTPPQGLVTPTDLRIDVSDPVSGHLRTSISGLGVPSVCSPDGSIRGVGAC